MFSLSHLRSSRQRIRPFNNSRRYQFEWLAAQGFDVVTYRMVTSTDLPDSVKWFAKSY